MIFFEEANKRANVRASEELFNLAKKLHPASDPSSVAADMGGRRRRLTHLLRSSSVTTGAGSGRGCCIFLSHGLVGYQHQQQLRHLTTE